MHNILLFLNSKEMNNINKDEKNTRGTRPNLHNTIFLGEPSPKIFWFFLLELLVFESRTD
jgi:hypothetical protein